MTKLSVISAVSGLIIFILLIGFLHGIVNVFVISGLLLIYSGLNLFFLSKTGR